MRSPRTPNSASPEALRRWATCWVAGPSTCRGAPGPMTRPWRCCWPKACSSADSTRTTRWAVIARWQREGYGSATGQCVGISANVARSLATALYKRQPFSGSHDPDQLDKDPLSRVAPVVMYFFRGCHPGHRPRGRGRPYHRTGTHGARLRAAVRRDGATGADGTRKSGRTAPAARNPGLPPALGRRCSPCTRGHMSAARPRRSPAAVTSCRLSRRHSGPFIARRAFAKAPCWPQTLAATRMWSSAIYGQLAGAYHSVSAIPGIWRNSLMRQEEVIETADRLLTHALVTLGD